MHVIAPDRASLGGFLRLAALICLEREPSQSMSQIMDKINAVTGVPLTKGGIDFILKKLLTDGFLQGGYGLSDRGRTVMLYSITDAGRQRKIEDETLCSRLLTPGQFLR